MISIPKWKMIVQDVNSRLLVIICLLRVFSIVYDQNTSPTSAGAERQVIL